MAKWDAREVRLDLLGLRPGKELDVTQLEALTETKANDRLHRSRALLLRERIERELGIVCRFSRGSLVMLLNSEREPYGRKQARLSVDRITRNAQRLTVAPTLGLNEAERRDLESSARRLSMAGQAANQLLDRRRREGAIFGAKEADGGSEEKEEGHAEAV
jgi:hypothetical protein